MLYSIYDGENIELKKECHGNCGRIGTETYRLGKHRRLPCDVAF